MSQSRRVQCLGVLLVACVAYCLALGGCADSPVEPTTTEPTDYIAYFADLNSDNWVFGYHILSEQVDSFQVPALPEFGMAISPDGNALYLAMRDSTVVVDIENPQGFIVLNMGARGGVAVSPDNEHVALLGDDLYILNTADYSVFYHDTNQIYKGVFSSNGSAFYAVGSTNDGEIDQRSYVYQLSMDQAAEASYTEMPYRRLNKIMPSDDEQTWFLSQSGFGTSAVDVYRVPADSIIYSMRIHPQSSVDFERSVDGRYVFFTYPCPWSDNIGVCDPPGRIVVFDVSAGIVAETIVIPDADTLDPFISGLNVGPLSATPDGLWLIGAAGNWIIRVDVVNMVVVDKVLIENATLLFEIVCQTSL